MHKTFSFAVPKHMSKFKVPFCFIDKFNIIILFRFKIKTIDTDSF